jgi:hypothetical protein
MAYHVAEDTASGFMIKNWFAAAGFEGIPAAFVVSKNGRIAWMGSPLELDPVLAKLFRPLTSATTGLASHASRNPASRRAK